MNYQVTCACGTTAVVVWWDVSHGEPVKLSPGMCASCGRQHVIDLHNAQVLTPQEAYAKILVGGKTVEDVG